MRRPNKAGFPAAEVAEGRHLAEGNSDWCNTDWTQCQVFVYSVPARVREPLVLALVPKVGAG
jgi:hypothetical protein